MEYLKDKIEINTLRNCLIIMLVNRVHGDSFI